MIRRVLDDPWRVLQAYALLLALVVLVAGVSHALSVDERPVVYMEREATR